MQNYMFLGLKSPYKSIFSLHFAQMALSAFAILAGLVASGSVFLNDLYFWGQSGHYINPYLFLIAFFLAFSPRVWGLAVIIFLLPLSAGLGAQLNAYVGTHFLILPNAGLDLVAGFFLGSALRDTSKASQFLGKNGRRDLTATITDLAPWPIALVILMITISTAIAISRNVYQSAAATSFKGLLFNFVHFRPIGWHDDYMPISDWIAYALAIAMMMLVIGQLKDQQNKNQMIFRPLMAGLTVAALMGICQAITGIGLPENLLSFRKDLLGYAVIGFQPDLHAFAGHMLLGAVGLWGYFYSGISRLERKLVLIVVALSWTGLILSKSRALLLIALSVIFIWLIWHLWKKRRHVFLPTIVILTLIIATFIALIFNFSNSLNGIPVLSWLGELANEFKSRDLSSWSLFSGIFGSRFEIWGAAIRMWWEFPLMGIGQGNFYRLSDIASFSKSHFLILNHGENAHNYFLQTLTETGLVGVAVFLIALLSPMKRVKNKKLLVPAGVSILSLFLGNIFSHSFLVRENLLLTAILTSLWWVNKTTSDESNFSIRKYRLFISGILVIMVFSIEEVYFSIGAEPFQEGVLCHKEVLAPDSDWTGGIVEFKVPPNSTQFEVNLKAFRLPYGDHSLPDIKIRTTDAKYNSVWVEFRGLDILNRSIVYQLPSWSGINIDNLKVQVITSTCFTPRNLGLNVDGRRLGFHDLKHRFY